jgi:cytochrome c oxidase cbb3-type subunit 3
MSSFWSSWIIILTVITIVGITWILFANRKRTQQNETTGHEYDGIEEYDNPLPGWWFAMFVITIVWGCGYLLMYPGMGNFSGLLGWTQLEQHAEEVAEADEKYRAMRDRYLALPVAEIAQDEKVVRMGMRIYGNNCSQCHGLDAGGAYGFPNLADDQWLWGGTPEAIKHTLVYGRQAAMPAWQDTLGEQGIDEVTEYVLTLNNRGADTAKAERGQKHFQTYCAACHGPDGKGNQALGAPNLTNGLWLYGGTAEQIKLSLRNGRNGKMPAYGEQLSEDKIHILAAYIYSLSNR